MKKLLVISSAPLIKINQTYFAYSPYEKEMQIWAKHSTNTTFCCPVWDENRGLLHSNVSFPIENIIALSEFNLKSFFNIGKSLYLSIHNSLLIFKAMKSADHIHLRCPGNMGLLGSIVQIAFPKKEKSSKYAGNWDPNAKQPWSYRLQKWILSNTFLTKNMQVLVYGEWPNSTKNIKSFFTASYSKKEIEPIQNLENENTFRFVFAGSLVKGKNPVYAIELIKVLKEQLLKVRLDIYGDGILWSDLQNQIAENNLQNEVFLHGNQSVEVLKKVFQNSHFVVLPSKSEGWPKVIAEGMFWGSVPLATPVSCVANMLGNGSQGILLTLNINHDLNSILALLNNPQKYQNMRLLASTWSREYTTDYFESEIKKMIR
jgi:glycosyltransferase involved in cell wall biosynthesis